MSIMALFSVTILLIVILIIPFIIGIYVYRDSKQRNMNTALWTIITVFAPALIGFIIYLLVRGNYSDLKCSNCNAPIKDDYVVCPACGVKLRPTCPKCQTPVEPMWIVCPKCAEPLPQYPQNIAQPSRPKDQTLWKILLCLIIIPIILVILIYLFLGINFSAGSASYQEVSVQEYFDVQESQEISEEVIHWMDSLDLRQSPKAYALRYAKDTGNSSGYYYLVYVPGASNHNERKFGQSTGLFSTTITLELNYTGSSGTFFCISSSTEKTPKLRIELDGDKIPCEVTEVTYNPTLYFITPEYELSDVPDGISVEAYVEQITTGPEMLPDQLMISKCIDSQEIGIFEFMDHDQINELIEAIDTFDYLIETPAFLENYTLEDYYQITIHYADTTGSAHYEETLDYYVIEQDDKYYLIQFSSEYQAEKDNADSQLPDNDNFLVIQIDKEFYGWLETLFTE